MPSQIVRVASGLVGPGSGSLRRHDVLKKAHPQVAQKLATSTQENNLDGPAGITSMVRSSSTSHTAFQYNPLTVSDNMTGFNWNA